MIKRYPEYAERELTFIGDIPSMHWDTVRCAHLFDVKNMGQPTPAGEQSIYLFIEITASSSETAEMTITTGKSIGGHLELQTR